jgi:hypothetical protein
MSTRRPSPAVFQSSRRAAIPLLLAFCLPALAGPTAAAAAAPPPTVELSGQALLDHEVGKVLLGYAREVRAGHVEQALSQYGCAALRSRRATLSAEEKKDSDAFRAAVIQDAEAFKRALLTGGAASVTGDEAFVSVYASETSKGQDGSTIATTFSSEFGLKREGGAWKLLN